MMTVADAEPLAGFGVGHDMISSTVRHTGLGGDMTSIDCFRSTTT
jgi:hypothetical protein